MKFETEMELFEQGGDIRVLPNFVSLGALRQGGRASVWLGWWEACPPAALGGREAPREHASLCSEAAGHPKAGERNEFDSSGLTGTLPYGNGLDWGRGAGRGR